MYIPPMNKYRSSILCLPDFNQETILLKGNNLTSGDIASPNPPWLGNLL